MEADAQNILKKGMKVSWQDSAPLAEPTAMKGAGGIQGVKQDCQPRDDCPGRRAKEKRP